VGRLGYYGEDGEKLRMVEKKKEEKSSEKKDSKARNAFSFIFLVSVVFLIATLTVLSVLKSGQLEFNFEDIKSAVAMITGEEQAVPKDKATPLSTVLSGGSAYAYVPCSRYLYVSSGQDITVYDPSGKAVHREIIEITAPITAYNAEIALIGDRDQKTVYVYKGMKRIALLELTGTIRYMSVNSKGYIAVLCDDTNAYSKISFFVSSGKKICDVYKRESVAVNAAVLSSGKEYTVNSVKTSGTGIETILEFSDFIAEAADAGHIVQNELFSVLFPLENGNLITGNEKGIYCFNGNAESVWKKETGKMITVSPIKNGLVYAYIDSQGQCHTVFADYEGNTLQEHIYGTNIVSIRTYDDIAAVNYGREVLFYNTEGTLSIKYSSKSDVLDVFPLGRTHAVSVTELDMTYIKLF
jgi:hypothetical protein